MASKSKHKRMKMKRAIKHKKRKKALRKTRAERRSDA